MRRHEEAEGLPNEPEGPEGAGPEWAFWAVVIALVQLAVEIAEKVV